MTIYSTGSAGLFRVGRSWSVSYTARDKAGNEAKCNFTFKLSGKYTFVLACLLNNLFPYHKYTVDQNNEFSLLKTFQYTNPFLEAYNWFGR